MKSNDEHKASHLISEDLLAKSDHKKKIEISPYQRN